MGGIMSLILQGSTSGSVTLQEPAVAGTTVLDLPATSGNVVVDSATQTLTNKSIVATQLTGTIAAARLPAGSVLQVVSAAKTDTFSTTSTSYTDITGLSVTLTPTSSSSKFLIYFFLCAGNQNIFTAQLVRNSTAIVLGDAAGSRTQATIGTMANSDANMQTANSYGYLDSPATASAVTYKVQVRTESGATNYINRSISDSNSVSGARTASSIIVMEIAG
jgi:hypothetical protein